MISTASGFFFLINGHACLVTSWHVVSGRHFLTHKPLSPKSYVPQRIRYYGLQYLDIAGRGAIARPPITVTLTDDLMAMLSMPPRSEERMVGKECVSRCKSRWSPFHEKKKKQ